MERPKEVFYESGEFVFRFHFILFLFLFPFAALVTVDTEQNKHRSRMFKLESLKYKKKFSKNIITKKIIWLLMLALEIKLFQSHSIWTQAVISYTYNKNDFVELSFFKFESKCFASETAIASPNFLSKETRIQP
jgi:Trk-type K+ transport system membrane component